MEITNTTLEVNRGNKLAFNFQIKNGDSMYTFDGTETITFAVYKASALNEEPLIEKDYTPDADTDTFEISLTSEETKIGDLSNEPIAYWYEITMNNETVLGYDKYGAKLFVVYPEGRVGNESNNNG